MASNGDAFTGKTMTVTLRNPPSVVTGKLHSINPGQGLVLMIWDAVHGPKRLDIASSNVIDVKVMQQSPEAPAVRPQIPTQIPTLHETQQEQHRQQRLWEGQHAATVEWEIREREEEEKRQQQEEEQQRQQQYAPPPFAAYQNQNVAPSATYQPQAQRPHQLSQPVHSPLVQAPYSQYAPQFTPAPPLHPQQNPQNQSSFVDPAILSMGKPPARGAQPTAAPSNLPPSAIATPSTAQPHFSRQPFPQPTNSTTQSPIPSIEVDVPQTQLPPQRVLVESMETLTVRAELADEPVETTPAAEVAEPEEQEIQSSQKKTRRRNRSRKTTNDTLDVEASSVRGARLGKKEKGKGWRETPILEDTAAFQPYRALHRAKATQDGWQSEDVTDVQDAGEFDFEGSLKKFDKRTIFGEMQLKDQTQESDRLVSHNRLQRPKPGTAGGKNLHYTDNVLDTTANLEKPTKKLPDDFWKSEADDGARNGSERLSGRGLGSRQSSRRGEGKAAAAKGRSQSRKASAADVGQAPSRTNSGVSAHKKAAKRRQHKPKYADIKKKLPSGASPSAGFIISQTKKRIEILSPLQMLNLESIAQNDLGLTEDMMTENAAHGIAEVTLHTLTDPALRVRLAAVDGSAPEPATVVILAGNNKSGYRSVAAGRHLRNKGLNVILCVVGIEKGERDLSVDMIKQLRLFKNCGGKVLNKSELFEFVRKASIPVISMDAPRSVLPQAPPMAVTLIIDALLGHVTPFEDLRAADQATVYELIEWTNRNEAFVMAVDVPTGVDHSDGSLTVQDGNSLYIRPRYVVSIGAPKKGLFEVIAAGAMDDEDNNTATGPVSDDSAQEWNLFLVDIGLGAAVWKRAGTRIRRGIDFGPRWAVQFNYQPSETDQAEE